MSQNPPPTRGKVFLVGAGPGDPTLITQRGIQCLARADLVLYDYLVNPQILEHAKPGAELVSLGRHGRDRLMPQAEINSRMIEAASGGRLVVRLKSGDPMIFGRAGEELHALRQAGIPFEIVPGVTAAVAVSAYAGVPLTERSIASAVAFATGQESDKEVSTIDFNALASFPGTLVIYMGITTAAQWSAGLMEGGVPPNTPAAIVRRCSWPDQQTFRCTLAEVPRVIAAERLRPPAVVIIGQVAATDVATDWFVQRPLFGRTVLITRAVGQVSDLRNKLEELGAKVLVQPAIRISPPSDWAQVDRAIEQIDAFDWIIFPSSNSVRYFLDRLITLLGDIRRLARPRLAAMGPGTAQALRAYHLTADLQPTQFRAESMIAALAGMASGTRFLLPRANRSRELLAIELRRAGGTVDEVIVYESSDEDRIDPAVADALQQGQVDYVTVTSSAIARSLSALFGKDLRRAKIASMSPVTSSTLRELGYEPSLEAVEYTTEGLAAAILADATAPRAEH